MKRFVIQQIYRNSTKFQLFKPLFSNISSERTEQLKTIFSLYDLNGDGYIDENEVAHMFSKTSKAQQGGKVNDQQIKELFQKVGSQSGTITFPQFATLFADADIKDIDSIMDYWFSYKSEISNAEIIFNTAWMRLEEKYGNQIKLPCEIIWLGGAPGSGKTVNAQNIMKQRDITAPPIITSSLLNSPEAKMIKDSGELVGDTEVVKALLEELTKPIYESGCLVDGFPRTEVQVECVRLLYQKMNELHLESLKAGKPSRKPIFRAILLFVEEKESVERQIKRGKEAIEHNRRVEETGVGELIPIRQTDIDIDAARKRYRVFKEQTFDSLNKLKQIFHFHFINAQSSLEEVRKAIQKELLYQSSLELAKETYEMIYTLPTAQEIIQNARQKLVNRLDEYQRSHKPLFQRVIQTIQEEFVPIIRMHAVSGKAIITTRNDVFTKEIARAMVIDVLSDRGFHVVSEVVDQGHSMYKFFITFPKPVTVN